MIARKISRPAAPAPATAGEDAKSAVPLRERPTVKLGVRHRAVARVNQVVSPLLLDRPVYESVSVVTYSPNGFNENGNYRFIDHDLCALRHFKKSFS